MEKVKLTGNIRDSQSRGCDQASDSRYRPPEKPNLQGRVDFLGCVFTYPGVPDFRMFLQEDLGQFWRLDPLFGHATQILVQQVDRNVDLVQHGHQFRCFVVERLGQAYLDGHGLVRTGFLFELHYVDLAHQWRWRPVVEKDRLAALVARQYGGIQRRAGARAEVGVGAFQAVALEHFAVVQLTGPAGRAVVETPFGWLFSVLEHGGVFAQVSDVFQVRGLGFQLALGIAFDHVARHVPAFDRADDGSADTDDLAGLLCLVPDLAAADPLFGEHLDIVAAQGVFHGDGVARQAVGLAVVAFFQHDLHHVGQQHGAFPVQAGEFHRFARLAPTRRLSGAGTGEQA